LEIIRKREVEEKGARGTKMITLFGKAGSGKSVLVNTLVTAMLRAFPGKHTVAVCAPTGAAAYNIGGKTIHNEWSIKVNEQTCNMCEIVKKKLRKRNKDLKMIIIDERSMLDAQLFYKMEQRVRKVVYGGKYEHKNWGNIPVVLLLGDNAQLESILTGVSHSIDSNCKDSNSHSSLGCHLFFEVSKLVLELKTIMRQDNGNRQHMRILESLRDEGCSEEDANYLCS
jgi:ABC-type dipeptide/oligopeptide/nickel transport system ATPase component